MCDELVLFLFENVLKNQENNTYQEIKLKMMKYEGLTRTYNKYFITTEI